MNEPRLEVMPIGQVESSLTDREAAPKQGHEGAPGCLAGIRAGRVGRPPGHRTGRPNHRSDVARSRSARRVAGASARRHRHPQAGSVQYSLVRPPKPDRATSGRGALDRRPESSSSEPRSIDGTPIADVSVYFTARDDLRKRRSTTRAEVARPVSRARPFRSRRVVESDASHYLRHENPGTTRSRRRSWSRQYAPT